jgi:hypothetical protein
VKLSEKEASQNNDPKRIPSIKKSSYGTKFSKFVEPQTLSSSKDAVRSFFSGWLSLLER